MKAIVLNESGSVDNLKYVDIPKPVIKEGEVLVKTISLSVNPVDNKTRGSDVMMTRFYGSQRPVILGWDLSGTIEEIGKDVTNFKMGDAVFGMANFPGNGKAYAEYVSVPSSHLALKPHHVSHQEAAAATLAALTAWQALVTNGKIKQGDKILIHGASGGVGHYATQIAKHFGAYVIGTSSAKNKNFVLSNGADEHVDYTIEDFENKLTGIDLVFNTVNASVITGSINITKSGGKIISIAGGVSPENIDIAKNRNIDLSAMMVHSSGEDMGIIADLMEKGIVKSHVSKLFSFDEMGEAHLQLETGRTIGKIVINI